MNGDVCFLITVLDSNTLLKCALKVDGAMLQGDLIEYPMEPENRATLHELLPEHVRNCGPIVDVESIFEIATN